MHTVDSNYGSVEKIIEVLIRNYRHLVIFYIRNSTFRHLVISYIHNVITISFMFLFIWLQGKREKILLNISLLTNHICKVVE